MWYVKKGFNEVQITTSDCIILTMWYVKLAVLCIVLIISLSIILTMWYVKKEERIKIETNVSVLY
ncbi:hypothetical protein QUI_2369 [Clostridioides difficile P59]|nr:hypothetical protein QUI_2369 [Clostridioides difficile P59]